MRPQGVPLFSTQPEPSAPAAHPRGLVIKIYVVMQRVYTRDPNRPNIRVLDVKLTQSAAQALVDQFPGSWWVRKLADKAPTITQHPVQRVAASS